jgi:hypothetical protein
LISLLDFVSVLLMTGVVVGGDVVEGGAVIGGDVVVGVVTGVDGVGELGAGSLTRKLTEIMPGLPIMDPSNSSELSES